MIYHCIRFTPKPGVSPEEVHSSLEQMHRTTDAMTPPVRWSLIGRDFGGEFEYGSVAVVDDLEAYEQMMYHPAHLELDRIGLPLVEKFMSFDITDDPDPAVGDKIADIHRRRFTDEPDIAELVSGIGDYTGSAAPGEHAE